VSSVVARAGEAVRRIRLGAVPYLNVEPLLQGLAEDPRFELVRDVPSRIAARLRAGEIDLGTIPSIEYASGDYAIVPDIAIGSRGPVESVVLLHRVPVESIERVALDTSSLTSVALVKILLRERLGRDPQYAAFPPDPAAMLGAADAALVIGDPALRHAGGEPRLDLGQAWFEATGLPFVFAFWAGRPGALAPEDVARLRRAKDEGRERIAQIASAYNGCGAGRGRQNEAYLRDNMRYALGEAEQAGLREFFRRAHALGLVAREPELRFHADR
jgi:chorismate dehydratase